MRRATVRALAAVSLLGGLLGGPAAPAQAAPAASRQVTLTADSMSLDATTRVATASGNVRITDGRTTATASRAILHHKEGFGVLSGRARVNGPQGALEGDEITVDYTTVAITKIVAKGHASLDIEGSLVSAQMMTIVPGTDTMTAQRDVTFFTQPDIVARGRELVYQRSKGTATLSGQASLQNRDGVLEGDRIEASKDMERLVATGSVRGKYRDIEVRSRLAEVFGAVKKAVFTGDVHLTQPGRRLTTERVTVWYGEGRAVAEGQTWIRIESTP